MGRHWCGVGYKRTPSGDWVNAPPHVRLACQLHLSPESWSAVFARSFPRLGILNQDALPRVHRARDRFVLPAVQRLHALPCFGRAFPAFFPKMQKRVKGVTNKFCVTGSVTPVNHPMSYSPAVRRFWGFFFNVSKCADGGSRFPAPSA